MTLINSQRKGCKDVFRAFLVENADYDGFLEIPTIEYGIHRPKKLVPFSKAISSNDHECWIHFYEDDYVFQRIWNNPKKYLPILERFNGVITPDFSLYRDMPLVMQFWNIYRSRAIGSWLQKNGIKVIPNIRFSDLRTCKAACYGITPNSTIAIGTHGCIKGKEDREYFVKGLQKIIDILTPQIIVAYGCAPGYIFETYKEQGIEILQFESEFSAVRREKFFGDR